MGKETGLGNQFYLDGVDLSGDTQSLAKISKAIGTVPMTGIDKSAMERKAGQLDGGFTWTSFFNPTNAHARLEDLPRTDAVATFMHRATLGSPSASCVGKQLNYDPKRDTKGGLTADVDVTANSYWMDWGLSLTAGKRSDTSATNGTGVDFSTAFNFGAQLYLQVFSFTGTSITIKAQGSSDNGVGDSFADITGGGFSVVSGSPLSQRIETARDLAVERYMRVVTSGTFSECTFAVMAVINRTDMTI